jgi:hypothetical protein
MSNKALQRILLPALTLVAAQAYGQLNIVTNFDSSITSDPNAATIEGTLNSVVSYYDSLILNPVTVHVTFQEMNSGLGMSNSWLYSLPYANYRSALQSNATTALDNTVLANLPSTSTDPVLGQTNMYVNGNLTQALGLGGDNSLIYTISLNTSICNLSRASINSSKYDLYAVASHELDEVLGFGSTIGGSLSGHVEPEDLFRYDQNGNRSYTSSGSATSYLSYNGSTREVQLNQNSAGDFGDFFVSGTPHVQDWAATPGITVNPGPIELRLLDAIGWNLNTQVVPEPAPFILLGLGVLALAARRRS